MMIINFEVELLLLCNQWNL